MTRKIATLDFKGVKCDKTTCDYRDEDIQFCTDGSQIGLPCPRCGSSLLTQESYSHVMAIIRMAESINSAYTEAVASGKISGTPDPENEALLLIQTEYSEDGIPNGLSARIEK